MIYKLNEKTWWAKRDDPWRVIFDYEPYIDCYGSARLLAAQVMYQPSVALLSITRPTED